jgi:GT2 family glycosyltransferase
MPQISFLILTYNSSSHISSFFDSLLRIIKKELADERYEVVIVDNASTDSTSKDIKEYLKDKKDLPISFYESEKNLGYAKGINKAAQNAKGEFFIVINPDAEVVEGEFEKVIDEYRNEPQLAIAGFTIVGFDGKRESTAGTFFNPFTFFLYAIGLEEKAGLRFSPDKKNRVDFVSGGFISFRKELFEKLNGYDKDYFMYVEDMDICYRAKKLGFKTFYLPFATLKHKGQGSSSREFAIINIYKGLQLFFEKNSSFLMTQYVKNLLTVKAALIIFIGVLFGKRELATTYLKALKSIS